MTSRASCCNNALLRKNITRFWPLWAMLTLALLVAYPMVLSFEVSYRDRAAIEAVYEMTFSFGILAAAAYAIVSAACLFHYLHNMRSAYMLHAFPVSRDSLFVTNVLSGLLFFLGPWLLTTGVSLLILAPCGIACVKAMLLCWLVLLLVYLFFFALAVFCMFLVGKTISGVLIYGVLNFIVITVEYLLWLAIGPALYGFDGLGDAITLPAVPIGYLISEGLSDVYIGPEYYNRIYSIHWAYIGILAVLGLGLLAAAWALYRRRHMESAGEVITVKWVRPIYQVIFALVGALTIGLLIAALLMDGSIQDSLTTLLACLCFGGFVGHFLAEMRLKKSVKVFRGPAFLRFGCFAVVLCLFVLSFYLDWFGIVRRVPAADRILSIELENDYNAEGVITLDTAGEIDEFRDLHKAILDNHDPYLENHDPYDGIYGGYYLGALRISYKLKDGSTMTRVYLLSDLEDDPTLLARAEDLLERPENVIEYYDSVGLWDVEIIELTRVGNETGHAYTTLAGEDCKKILESFYQDAAAGNMPVFFSWISEYDYQLQFYLPDGRYYFMHVPASAAHTRAVLDAVEFPEN